MLLSEVIEKSGMPLEALRNINKKYNLSIPLEKDDQEISINNYIILRKTLDILSQKIPEAKVMQKIGRIINSKGNITISDVAMEARVSISLVSRILNNRDNSIKISKETEKRILETAKYLGYKANPVASALRSRQSGIIGAVVRDIGDPFLRQLVQEVQLEYKKQDSIILMSHAMHETEMALQQIKHIVNCWFDGLIIVGDMVGDSVIFNELVNNSLPVVSLAGRQHEKVSTVTFDDESGVKQLFVHLYNLGHRSIAFMGNILHTSVKNRMQTFIKLQKEAGLFVDPSLFFTPKNNTEAAQCVKTILTLEKPPTAILCTSDGYAQLAVNVAIQAGWKVPEDITVTGYNGTDESQDLYIPLTTMRQPTGPAAVEAVKELNRQIRLNLKDSEYKPVNILIPPELIIRASSAAPRH
jgi:LacI family transcriptional regulator